jgi:hypothetical protein
MCYNEKDMKKIVLCVLGTLCALLAMLFALVSASIEVPYVSGELFSKTHPLHTLGFLFFFFASMLSFYFAGIKTEELTE